MPGLPSAARDIDGAAQLSALHVHAASKVEVAALAIKRRRTLLIHGIDYLRKEFCRRKLLRFGCSGVRLARIALGRFLAASSRSVGIESLAAVDVRKLLVIPAVLFFANAAFASRGKEKFFVFPLAAVEGKAVLLRFGVQIVNGSNLKTRYSRVPGDGSL